MSCHDSDLGSPFLFSYFYLYSHHNECTLLSFVHQVLCLFGFLVPCGFSYFSLSPTLSPSILTPLPPFLFLSSLLPSLLPSFSLSLHFSLPPQFLLLPNICIPFYICLIKFYQEIFACLIQNRNFLS